MNFGIRISGFLTSGGTGGSSPFDSGVLEIPGSLITWTGTTAPSGATNNTYQWSRIGNTVTYQFILSYATPGSAITQVAVTKPSDMPSPIQKSGQTSGGQIIYRNYATMATGLNVVGSGVVGCIRNNAGNTSAEFVVATSSGNYRFVIIQGEYFTQ